jgi:hypothetical protein
MKFKIENYSLLVLSPTNRHGAQRTAGSRCFGTFLGYMKFKIENYSLLVLSPTNLHVAQRTAAASFFACLVRWFGLAKKIKRMA